MTKLVPNGSIEMARKANDKSHNAHFYKISYAFLPNKPTRPTTHSPSCGKTRRQVPAAKSCNRRALAKAMGLLADTQMLHFCGKYFPKPFPLVHFSPFFTDPHVAFNNPVPAMKAHLGSPGQYGGIAPHHCHQHAQAVELGTKKRDLSSTNRLGCIFIQSIPSWWSNQSICKI